MPGRSRVKSLLPTVLREPVSGSLSAPRRTPRCLKFCLSMFCPISLPPTLRCVAYPPPVAPFACITFLSVDVLRANSVVLKIWAICTSILNPRPTHPIQVGLRCRGRFLLTSPRSDLGYIFLRSTHVSTALLGHDRTRRDATRQEHTMENYGDPSGGYNFPPQQYMVPPPAPYMAPQQFYANLTALHSPVPTSETPVPTPCKRVASNSQPQSPPKHKRGRPAGSTKAKMAAAQKAKPAAKSQPKVAQRNSVKENIPPPEMIELSDSDNEIEKTDTGKIRHWQPDERTTFYRFLLAFDPVGDKRLCSTSTKSFAKASEILFSGERSAASIKSMWLCSLNAFQWIRAFESFTAIKKKLAAARKLGLPLGSLKPSTITEWEDNGWWDLFNDRCVYSRPRKLNLF
ncbi:hypothetical protein B0H13DRAFT_2561643 [Mycena leptocephala]|nr:hypothetical protein B0H13DRAFT_2561643 [Mycena leptocephala]